MPEDILQGKEDVPPPAVVVVMPDHLSRDDPSSSSAHPTPSPVPKSPAGASPEGVLAQHDLQALSNVCRQYENVKDAYDINFVAKWQGTRQMAIFIVCFIIALEIIGVVVFMRVAGYTLNQALLFSHYSFTSCGFGNYPIPTTPGYQTFLIVYLLVGIGATMLMAAQMYQYVVISSKFYKHKKLQEEFLQKENREEGTATNDDPQKEDAGDASNWFSRLFVCDSQDSSFNHILFVIVVLSGLLLSGTFMMMGIEGTTFAQGLYFSTFTMLTTGYGDITPVTEAGTWFTVFWLPFNILFLSVFWGNVVNVYAMVADWNVSRHERAIKSEVAILNAKERQQAKKDQEQDEEVEEDLDQDGNVREHTLTDDHHDAKSRRGSSLAAPSANPSSRQHASLSISEMINGVDDRKSIRDRRHIKSLSDISGMFQQPTEAEDDTAMFLTMKDVISFVRSNIVACATDDTESPVVSDSLLKFFTVESTSKSSMPFHENGARIPSFVLLLLVQERIAHILCKEIAGTYQIELAKGNTVGIAMDGLSAAMRKWRIPHGARSAFVAVAFEALLFVGAETLSAGPDALLEELSPFECQALFSPLLASLGDAGTMEGWLAQTERLMVLGEWGGTFSKVTQDGDDNGNAGHSLEL